MSDEDLYFCAFRKELISFGDPIGDYVSRESYDFIRLSYLLMLQLNIIAEYHQNFRKCHLPTENRNYTE
jgi:hypothetical protein